MHTFWELFGQETVLDCLGLHYTYYALNEMPRCFHQSFVTKVSKFCDFVHFNHDLPFVTSDITNLIGYVLDRSRAEQCNNGLDDSVILTVMKITRVDKLCESNLNEIEILSGNLVINPVFELPC